MPSGRRPEDQTNWTTFVKEGVRLYYRQLINDIHSRHLLGLLLLSPEDDIHFSILSRIAGWVDLGGWLDSLPASRRSLVTLLTGPDVE